MLLSSARTGQSATPVHGRPSPAGSQFARITALRACASGSTTASPSRTSPPDQHITVDAGADDTARVTLVLPEGDRRDRAGPSCTPCTRPASLRSGGPARCSACWAARPRLRDCLAEYRQNYIAAKPPFVAEHAAILDAVARRVHIDANRVYAFGYSKGGFAAWYVTLYFADRFAGAVSLAAGFDVAPGLDGFWRQLVPNVAHVPVLNAWGGQDPLIIRDLAEKPAGTFAESNRWFAQAVRGMRLPITNIEVAGGMHNKLTPPGEAIVDHLNRRRAVDPPRVAHVFRHLHQASSYWIEGLTWVGDRGVSRGRPGCPAR